MLYLSDPVLNIARDMEKRIISRAGEGPNADPPPAQRIAMRVTALTMGCARKAWFWKNGAPKRELVAASAAALSDGNLHESQILDDLATVVAERGLLKGHSRNVRVSTEWFTGTIDCILETDTATIVVDSKTANAAAFDMVVKGKVSEEYAAQLNLYMHALKSTDIFPIDPNKEMYGLLVYRNKDPKSNLMRSNKEPDRVYHLVRVDYDVMCVSRMKDIADMGYGDKVPNRPDWAYRGHWKCQYCDYNNTCWDGE